MIIGGLGCIDNDFHECKNCRERVRGVCRGGFRRRGIAGKLLLCVRGHAQIGNRYAIPVTDHTSLYEAGWEYLRMVKADGSPKRRECTFIDLRPNFPGKRWFFISGVFETVFYVILNIAT